MKTAAWMIAIAFGFTGFMVMAQDQGKKPQGLIKETGLRVVLTNGNELYAWCTVAEKVATPGDGDRVNVSGSRDDAVTAAMCWAYIEGVIDSTPVGGEFSPGPDVRVSQYVDVVTAYLKEHANIRDQPAASLVRKAMAASFPHP